MTIRRVGEVIDEFLQSRRIRERRRLGGVAEAWNFIVGEEIGRATRVAGVKNGVLTVEVESSAIRHELAVLMKDEILERLKTLAPRDGVTSVRYLLASPQKAPSEKAWAHPGKGGNNGRG